MHYVLNGRRVRKLTYKKEMAALRQFLRCLGKGFTSGLYDSLFGTRKRRRSA